MKKIKFPKLIKTDDWEGYAIEDIKAFLPKYKYSEFCNWYSGQTGGVSKDGRFCVYKDDWEKYLRYAGIAIG
jgi:hypothetical protein